MLSGPASVYYQGGVVLDIASSNRVADNAWLLLEQVQATSSVAKQPVTNTLLVTPGTCKLPAGMQQASQC